MKKALLVLALLCVAGIFSAKAQSSSDSAYVRNLSYTYINAGNLPYSNSGDISISAGGKILKDIRSGCRAKGYTINLTSSKSLDIKISPSSWDSYLFVLDTNYDTIIFNDNLYSNNSLAGSRIIHNFPAGLYYIIVSENAYSTNSATYTISVSEMSPALAELNTLTYTPLTLGTPVTDTLKTTDGPIAIVNNSHFNNAAYARGYSIQITNPCVISASTNRSSNRYMKLLDNNFNDLGYSGIISTPGTYHLVIYSTYYFDNDTSTTTPFTLTTGFSPIVNYNDLTYKPLGTVRDTAVYDTFTNNFPSITNGSYLYKASGYTFQGTQNKIISIKDSNSQLLYVLMDNNYNILKMNWHNIYTALPQTGTYRLAVLDYYTRNRKTTISIKDLQTYYVDYLNGDDSRNGFTPATAIRTLDTAVARSGGIGKYYLTEDYTFSSRYLVTRYAQIYPYQKDIRLHLPAYADNSLDAVGDLFLGEQGGNYHFIIDSSHTDFYYALLYGYSGSHIELNNIKVRNSYFTTDFITNGDEVVIRNCEFVNDTIDDDFIQISHTTAQNVHFINTDFSQNQLKYYLVNQDYNGSMTITLENTNVVGNTFGYVLWMPNYSTVNLVSGNWRNNRPESDYRYNGNPNLTAQNCGGIWLWGVTANIGAGFTMDANNYICIDTTATVNITENLSAPFVAQIYPMKWDDGNSKYIADYYEGRRLLSGSASMLRANYQKFSVAQADNASLWYLHSDGKIYTTEEQIGIETADNAAVRMYPNPAADKVTVELQNTSATEICVMDIYGKTVVRQAVNSQSEVLDLGNLAKGMYFVQIRNNSKVEATQKLVKK